MRRILAQVEFDDLTPATATPHRTTVASGRRRSPWFRSPAAGQPLRWVQRGLAFALIASGGAHAPAGWHSSRRSRRQLRGAAHRASHRGSGALLVYPPAPQSNPCWQRGHTRCPCDDPAASGYAFSVGSRAQVLLHLAHRVARQFVCRRRLALEWKFVLSAASARRCRGGTVARHDDATTLRRIRVVPPRPPPIRRPLPRVRSPRPLPGRRVAAVMINPLRPPVS